MLEKTLTNDQVNLLNSFIDNLESNFPSSSVYLDVSKGEVKEFNNKKTKELLLEVKQQIDYAKNMDLDCVSIINAFIKTEPYCNDEELIEELKVMIDREELVGNV